jgi:membrane fusion protein, multidrug efflux system
MDVFATMREVITYFVVLAGLAVLLAAGCSPAPVETADALPQAVRTTTVRQGAIAEGRRYLATVAPADTVRVLAQVPGTVLELPVGQGASAQRRTTLARIGAPELAARLARARAEGLRAQQQRDFACDHLDTDRELAAGGVMTAEQLDVSENNCASAELAVAAARAAQDDVGVASNKTVERAPFDGQVLEHFVDEGQAVMPGTPLVLFATSELQLLLRLPQAELTAGVSLGATVLFEGGRGEVVEVGGQAKGPGALVDVRVSLPAASPELMVGATLPVRLIVAELQDTTSVPLEAVGSDDDGDYVLLVRDERALRHPITLGPRDDGWVAVQPALPAGTAVIVRALSTVDLNAPLFAVEVGS